MTNKQPLTALESKAVLHAVNLTLNDPDTLDAMFDGKESKALHRAFAKMRQCPTPEADSTQEVADRVRAWFELYRAVLPKSAAGDLALILSQYTGDLKEGQR